MNYLPLLIAVSKTSGAYSDSLEYNEPFDTHAKYGLWIKHSPFTIRPKAKNIISQTWKDEDGDDVFIPDTIYHEPYSVNLEFIYLRTDNNANENIRGFIKEIEGKWLKIYDSYSQIGRQAVFMEECDEDPTFKRRTWDYLYFKVKFKVNDPDTDIVLSLT